MRIARGVLLFTSLALVLALAGCTLQGTGAPDELLEALTPTSEAQGGTETPQPLEATPLGGEIEAQELGEALEEGAEAVEEELPEETEEGLLDEAEQLAEESADLLDEAEEEVVEEPAATVEAEPADTARPGELLFVRDGQVWSTSAEGLGEEQVSDLPDGAVVRDLTISPTGQYAAFTVNNSDVVVLDLFSGQQLAVDEAAPDIVSRLAWTPTGSALYYQKTTADPENIPAADADGLWHVIYEVPADPIMAPAPITAVPEAAGSEIGLRFALGDRRLLLSEHPLGAEGVSRLLLLDRGLAPLPVEGFQSIQVLDLSPDQTRLLFLDESDWVEAGPDSPVPLYRAQLNSTEGLVDAAPIALDETSAYQNAVFAPGGERIAAVRSDVPFDTEAGSNVVLLSPSPDGGYEPLVLSALDGYRYPTLAWYDEEAVVVQRVPVTEGASEIWLLPLDGEPGLQLAEGEQPVVVPGLSVAATE